MKTAMFLGIVAALVTAPALADNGQHFDNAAQFRAYDTGRAPEPRQCFNGAAISGVNRSGSATLYVQSKRGAIYDLRLQDNCAALDAAQKISLTTTAVDSRVCVGDDATLVVRTPTGNKHCRISDVRRLDASDASRLTAATR